MVAWLSEWIAPRGASTRKRWKHRSRLLVVDLHALEIGEQLRRPVRYSTRRRDVHHPFMAALSSLAAGS